ncbi:hypothetical protein BCM02_105107 [Paenibacillus methanolicus]|uniref:Uncharacterized protein n=2 Tax=Paenibacillus methanolicus TaxID=582686 RepID=A0A5S5C9A7_9BACL|nr:hypothetical protein BCM02_105107 [Paenibacillus methanolicus]
MDFTAYMSHSLNKSEIADLCNRLNENPTSFPLLQAFIDELLPFNPRKIEKEWHVDFDYIGGTTILAGPCGISLTLSENVCYFHHYLRWRQFLINPDLQIMLRKVCYELREIFNASFVIYVPDNAARESAIMDFIWEGENRDIDYMREWLLVNCGPPKNKIVHIYKKLVDSWESDGYYIDYFQDREKLLKTSAIDKSR